MIQDRIPWEKVEEFRRLNPRVPPIELRISPIARWRRACGYYRPGYMAIYPDLCQKIGGGYSWPGNVSDRTLAGVMAHEMGHHVHHTDSRANDIRRTFPRNRRVTSYEPNADEAFAESFRLFMLNPSLLREGRRERYDYLLRLDLVPIEHRHWREVLEGAPQRFFDRIEQRWLTAS